MASELLYIPLNKIRTNKVALRDANRTSEAFLELKDSIKSEGVLNAISVRRRSDPNDDKEFELVDGLQRFTATTEVGTGVVDKNAQGNQEGRYQEVPGPDGSPIKIGLIPAQVIDREQAEVLITQIITNAQKIETKPTEYAAQIIRYFAFNPTITEAQLAAQLKKSPAWITKILSLNRLHPNIKPLVDSGNIPLVNATNLAKLPPEEQLNWLDRAQTVNVIELAPQILKRVKEIKDANRKGEAAGEEQFTPVRHLRTKKDIEDASANPEEVMALLRDSGALDGLPKNPQGLMQAAAAGAKMALNWATSYDPKSVAAQKEKYESRKKQDTEQKIRRDEERAKKKEQEMADKLKKAREEAEKARAAAAQLPPLEPATAGA